MFFLWALLLLTIPLPWLAGAGFSALFHEFFHLVSILLTKGQIHGFRFHMGGILLDTELPGSREELICALAGPGGSILLSCLYPWVPRLAVCALVQGMFNLIPVYPLDGGRAARILLIFLFPQKGERIHKNLEILLLSGLLIVSLIGFLFFSWGLIPLFVSLVLSGKRKSPCKEQKIRVQ